MYTSTTKTVEAEHWNGFADTHEQIFIEGIGVCWRTKWQFLSNKERIAKRAYYPDKWDDPIPEGFAVIGDSSLYYDEEEGEYISHDD
jgi:hypothetical protein